MTSASSAPKGLLRVAVVDDDQSILMVLAEILADAGFTVTTFGSAPPCIESVKRGEVDFIFSDINMPEMSGVELLQTVKGFNEEIEVVIMTADARVDSAIEATRWGAVDYIHKPFDNIESVMEVAKKAAQRVLDGRRQRAIERQHAKDETQGFKLQGQLEETSLSQVLQVVASMGRDGVLSIGGPPLGAVYLGVGTVVHVEWGELRGEKALYRLLRAGIGTYRLGEYQPPATGTTMSGSIQTYVLDGARRNDEFAKLSAKLPDLDAKWSMNSQCAAPLSQLAPWLVGVLADIIRAGNARAALDNGDYFDLDILGGVRYLYQLGAFVVES